MNGNHAVTTTLTITHTITKKALPMLEAELFGKKARNSLAKGQGLIMSRKSYLR